MLKRLNRFIAYLLLAFLFLNPFPHINTITDSCFYLGVLFALYLFVKEKKEPLLKTPLLFYFSLFFIWSFLSCLFALDKPDSFITLYSHFLKYMLVYFMLICFFSSEIRVEWIAWTIVISETLFTLGALIYHYGVLGHPIDVRVGFQASAIDIIGFGMITGAVFSIHLFSCESNLLKKIFLFCSTFILAVSTLLTQSRGAFLSMVVAFTVLFLGKKKIKAGAMLLAVILVIMAFSPLKNRLFTKEFFRDHARMGLILYSVEVIKDYPLLGTGFSIDTFRNETHIDREKYKSRIPEKYAGVPFLWPHNMLLSIGVRTGIIGMLFYLLIFAKLTKMCLDIMKSAVNAYYRDWGVCMISLLAMFFINGMVQPVFVHFLDTLFYTLCALITILWKLSNVKEGLSVCEPSGKNLLRP